MSSTSRRRRGIGVIVAVIATTIATGAVATGTAEAALVTPPNACLGLTNTISDLPIPITATAPASITLGETATVSGLSVTIAITQALVAAGIGAGVVQSVDSVELLGGASGTDGKNTATVAIGNATLDVTATNSVEGTQRASNPAAATATFWVVLDPVTAAVTIYTGDVGSFTEVTSVVVTMPLGDLTFTSTGGDMVFSEQLSSPTTTPPNTADKAAADLRIISSLGGLNVPFYCWLGTANDPANGALTPATSSPALATTTVIAPPTAPSCTGSAPSVPAGQSVTIDFTARCTDVNGNGTIDWNSIGFGWGNPASPTTCIPVAVLAATGSAVCTLPGGTLTGTVGGAGLTGVFTYTNTDTSATTELFGFTVGDTSCTSDGTYQAPFTCSAGNQRRSTTALINIGILQGTCEVQVDSCDVQQIIEMEVQAGTSLGMSAAVTDFVTLTTQTLDGDVLIATGAINTMTVENTSGNGLPWSVVGTVSDFTNEDYTGDGCSAEADYDRNCIPATNLSWDPDAEVAHMQIPGDVATVTAGDAGSVTEPWTTGLAASGSSASSTSTLCSSPEDQSGGTFTCDADLYLGVPATAAIGTYSATLTLTLS